ncbi:MAG TPA: glycoside hydrolase family 2 protein [Terriglobales bacterium]|nr:glycoside hydrolase family 2 protein [Terriglobales bacterium]
MPRQQRILAVCLFAVLSSVLALAQATNQKRDIPLNSGWEFRQLETGDWRPAQVPGDVHLDLLRNKLIPDPFYRDNEAKLQWIEDADWEYRTTIQATPDVLNHKNIELVFEGLDAYAKVYLNDQLVLTADNMFREWRVNAKPVLKAGTNQLHIVFPSPIKAAAEIAATDKWREQTHTAEKTYIRKAAYEYGWDWGPRFVTSGVWRPAKLEVWDAARISNLHIAQRDVSSSVAHLLAQVEVTASEDASGKVTLDYTQSGKKMQVARAVVLHAGVNHIDFPIDIDNPQLWYPAGYGAQALYQFNAQLGAGNRAEDQVSTRTGLRSIVLRRELDQWGRSFEFIINGVPVFGKGADVIPFDSFPSRVTLEDYRRILQSARDANMNMIRHWGGGYYETDEFYSLCDELGIMVWQDFMFGNDWQPGLYDWKQNVEKEAEYQVRRLRDHPSIIIWCGNNETEEAFHWGGRDQLPPQARLQMWQDYLTVFSGILNRVAARLIPESPYWPSSPSSDYEETTPEFQSGDYHDWSVWHGRVPFSEYEKHFPRFVTEYGFQSFPEMKTVEAFTAPEDRTSIFTPVMLAHQKNNEGNSIIHDYMLRYYSEPKDFASFLYASQVLQAEGIKIGAEHWRRNRPRIMGSIFWQLNDCWPVASWASIDYYARWKALQYYARRFYNDLLVSPHEENGIVNVYVVSDRTVPVSASLKVRLLSFDGTVLTEKTQTIDVAALSSKVYVWLPISEFLLLKNFDPDKTFITTELVVGNKPVSNNLLFLAPPKELQLPAPKITNELSQSGSAYRLKLASDVLAKDVYVSFGDLDATYSDNYIDLLPGQPVEIEVKSPASLDQLKSALKIVSLTDAFAPAGSTK